MTYSTDHLANLLERLQALWEPLRVHRERQQHNDPEFCDVCARCISQFSKRGLGEYISLTRGDGNVIVLGPDDKEQVAAVPPPFQHRGRPTPWWRSWLNRVTHLLHIQWAGRERASNMDGTHA